MQKTRRQKTRDLLCVDCTETFSRQIPARKFIHGPIGQLKWPLKVSGTAEALECPDCGSENLRKTGCSKVRVVRLPGGR